MSIKIHYKFFDECYIFSTKKFADKRGFFLEIFNEKVFKKNFNQKFNCKQINYVYSKKNSIRGFHLQKKPFGQKKIIRVLEGEIIDYVLDLRKTSKSFGMVKQIPLSEKSNKQILIPENFGHGYFTKSERAKVIYFCSENYNKKSEITVNLFNDKIELKIPKKINLKISKKDKYGISLKKYLNNY